MSRIDELQRLHEKHRAGEPGSDKTAAMGHTLFVDLHYSWPAIHRVLVAAREVAGNTADDIDGRLRYVEVRPHRDEWNELVEALRALDGGLPADQ